MAATPVGLSIRIDLLGEDQIQRTLAGRIAAASDMRPAWEQIADDFAEVERAWFASKGGGTWPPLSAKYAHWKARRYPGMPIMRRSDDLYRSLTIRPFGVEFINRDRMEIGTSVYYALYHQRPPVPGRPPQRPVVALQEATRRRWVRLIQAHLVGTDRLINGLPAWGPPAKRGV